LPIERAGLFFCNCFGVYGKGKGKKEFFLFPSHKWACFFNIKNRVMTTKRKLALSAFCILFLHFGCKQGAPKQEAVKPVEVLQNFASGEVSRRHTEINGKKEGTMTEYYIDGSVRSKRIFKNDLQVGRTEFFYPKGQIKEVQFFSENGLKHGGDTSFYENGKPQLVMGFKDGKKDGYLRKWSPEGLLVYEARYEMDTLVEVKGEVLKKRKH
jgi:antitoxin component YwqK of YwqJK toxin-antitoxin module